MPEEILDELLAYLNEREGKINDMRGQGFDIESQMLESEQNFMGQEFKPKVEYEEPSEDENAAKMNQVKGMDEVGKQINQQLEPYVNHEGLKRVYKPRAEREAEAQANDSKQSLKNPFKTDIYNNPVSMFDDRLNPHKKPPLPT